MKHPATHPIPFTLTTILASAIFLWALHAAFHNDAIVAFIGQIYDFSATSLVGLLIMIFLSAMLTMKIILFANERCVFALLSLIVLLRRSFFTDDPSHLKETTR